MIKRFLQWIIYGILAKEPIVTMDSMDKIRWEAQREQMERDCRAVCARCNGGEMDIRMVRGGLFVHWGKKHTVCHAEPIRQAWAALNDPTSG